MNEVREDVKKDVSVDPIVVKVIGRGPEVGPTGTIAETPAGQANLITKVISPLTALGVRFAHRFVDALIGAEGLRAIDTVAGWHMIPGDTYKVAVLFALTTAVWGLLRDVGTILTKLEGKFPLTTGNV